MTRLAAALVAASFLHAGAVTSAALPKVSLDYSWLLDDACSDLKGEHAPEAVAELKERMPEFRGAWERNEKALFEQTVAITGRPFQFPEVRAAMVVCGLPSMS